MIEIIGTIAAAGLIAGNLIGGVILFAVCALIDR